MVISLHPPASLMIGKVRQADGKESKKKKSRLLRCTGVARIIIIIIIISRCWHSLLSY